MKGINLKQIEKNKPQRPQRNIEDFFFNSIEGIKNLTTEDTEREKLIKSGKAGF